MNTFQSNRRKSQMVLAAVAAALLAGCASPAPSTTTASSNPPSLSASTTGPSLSADSATTESTARQLESPPVSVSIPAIGTNSELIELGLNADGTIEVPATDPGSPAGWYTGSPKPGEIGPSILLGHVNDTDGGPGVFAELRELTAGDIINVADADGSVTGFRFVKGEQYSKSSFPSELVYGNTAGAELRLITCDGFNETTGDFDDNYVVYAELFNPATD